MDVDARIQLFDLKTKYQFQTVPGVDQYNMPLYDLQFEGADPTKQTISFYPVYQGFTGPAFVNGVPVSFHTDRRMLWDYWSNYVQSIIVLGTGNGTSGPYNLQIPFLSQSNNAVNAIPSGLLRGHVDITGIVASGNAPDDPIFSDTLLPVPTANAFAAVYLTSLDINGNSLLISDSGQFLNLSGNNLPNWGLLMVPGGYPLGNSEPQNGYTDTFSITGATNTNPVVLTATTNFAVGELVTIQGVTGMTELNGKEFEVLANSGTTIDINVNGIGFGAYTGPSGTVSSLRNVINYQTGEIRNVFFADQVKEGQNINGQCYFYNPGMPLSIMFNNNVLIFRTVPDKQYRVELDAYLSPAAFLTSAASVPFAYMCEYIARGAARKILSDTGDVEQFQFYEPLFREQEILVWKRSQRQNTVNRVPTIYSHGPGYGQGFGNGYGNQGVF
jgi:hypothetical protein